eukprot:CAMPEP_0194503432 /NCGR_PEP_ID=MMETSP0253-20130528/28377_1 /TAXON_ID=2966 /ORGANISM="Noctiluca scintillans" /LENGTH=147 /DNA_ID=CAMNT_0039345715 /DNA_START=57 /DNA_END=500 /DNA_ORIENTATION=-
MAVFMSHLFLVTLFGTGVFALNSTMVDLSCPNIYACEGFGGCYEAETSFLKDCMIGKAYVVESLMPKPIFLQTSCLSLGFKILTRTSTGTTVPDPCYGGWASFYATDEDTFWERYPAESFPKTWCPEWRAAVPNCFSAGSINGTQLV